jgi:hypothetical protein
LAPGFQNYVSGRLAAGRVKHEVHPGEHEAVLQESELHVLPSDRGLGVVFFPIVLDFVEHLLMHFQAVSVGEQVKCVSAI